MATPLNNLQQATWHGVQRWVCVSRGGGGPPRGISLLDVGIQLNNSDEIQIWGRGKQTMGTYPNQGVDSQNFCMPLATDMDYINLQ